MRAELDRLIGFSPERSAARATARFSPGATRIIERHGAPIGTYTLQPTTEGRRLEMFYLEPALQGSGIGTAVLRQILDEVGTEPVHLQVLVGSRARPLYERHGFVLTSSDGIDDELTRLPR